MKKLIAALAIAAFPLLVIGCNDEPDTLGEAIEEAGDEMGDAVEEIADEVEDARDEIKK